MAKEARKMWPRKECLVHMIHPFLTTAPAGTLCASWYWQVGIDPPTNLPLGAAFSHYEAPQNRRAGFNTHFVANYMCLSCCFHTQSHSRVNKVQQKTCLLGEQRARALSILTLSWDRGWAPKMKGCCCEPCVTPRLATSRGEDFDPGSETRLDHLGLFV